MQNSVIVDLKKLKDVECVCGCKEFIAVQNLKVLPALLSPTRKQEFALTNRWKCVDCGTLIPVEYK